ncbi:conserved unknown protein [Ectocarpus siliculosus]|uniref:Uncharacterized protein n=1 Tax=Ectocarpus siliculosus TaxID=2880 RepID=D7FP88_ECTSI|nr:conserved unknown protein [Ectocarpus siliculosus]|eukprot:CBJ30349.1 conserved unknown protein [Ectocarpus siliculosus]
MFPTRSMIGVLAMLLLSARLEAFSVRPAVTRRGSKADSSSSRSGRALAPSAVPDRGTSAAASWLWTGASRRPRSTALRMGLETVTGLTSTDMQTREFQLEELEDRDVAETSVVLNEDGSVTAGKTNGPIPIQVRGKWSFDGTAFRMDLHREFDASIPYMVSRVMTGYVEEVLSATDTVIITGDIVMEEMEVGFFKMISSQTDLMDSIQHIDQQMAKIQA